MFPSRTSTPWGGGLTSHFKSPMRASNMSYGSMSTCWLLFGSHDSGPTVRGVASTGGNNNGRLVKVWGKRPNNEERFNTQERGHCQEHWRCYGKWCQQCEGYQPTQCQLPQGRHNSSACQGWLSFKEFCGEGQRQKNTNDWYYRQRVCIMQGVIQLLICRLTNIHDCLCIYLPNNSASKVSTLNQSQPIVNFQPVSDVRTEPRLPHLLILLNNTVDNMYDSLQLKNGCDTRIPKYSICGKGLQIS